MKKARNKVREIEREKVSAHNLHSLFSAPFNPLESSPLFVDVSLRVRLSFFPQLLRDRSTVEKPASLANLSLAPALNLSLALGTSEAKVQVPCL